MAENSSAPTTKVTLTDRDTEVLLAALQCGKGGPFEIDTKALAEKLAFKTPAVANSVWYKLKQKIGLNQTTLPKSDATPSKAKTPRKPKAVGNVAATTAATDGANDHIVPETATEVPDDIDNGDENMDHIESTSTVDKGKGKAMAANHTSILEGAEGTKATILSSPTPVAPATPEAPKSITKSKKAKAVNPAKATADAFAPTENGADSTDAVNATPVTPTPKKRARKTEAEKEAEAAAAGEGADDDGEKPAKKARKTPVKKAKTEAVEVESGLGELNVTPNVATTPVKAKTPRKPTGAGAKAGVKKTNEDNDVDDAGDNEVEGEVTPVPMPKTPKKTVKKAGAAKALMKAPASATAADDAEAAFQAALAFSAAEFAKAALARNESSKDEA